MMLRQGVQAADTGDMPQTAPIRQSYRFRVQLTYRTGQDDLLYFDTLSLTVEQAEPGPASQWPDAFCRAPDGTQVQLTPGQPHQRVLVFQFPLEKPIRAIEWPRITLEWKNLSVAVFQNARASMSVRRNQKLLGSGGPDTAPDFLYQTPTIDAADIVTPLNTWSQRIDITAMGTGVAGALQATFQAVFGATTGYPSALVCSTAPNWSRHQ